MQRRAQRDLLEDPLPQPATEDLHPTAHQLGWTNTTTLSYKLSQPYMCTNETAVAIAKGGESDIGSVRSWPPRLQNVRTHPQLLGAGASEPPLLRNRTGSLRDAHAGHT